MTRRFQFLSLIVAIATAACLPVHLPPPPAPTTRTITVFGAQPTPGHFASCDVTLTRQRVAAVLTGRTDAGGWGTASWPHTSTLNDQGTQDAALNTHVHAICDGYQPIDVGGVLPASGNVDIFLGGPATSSAVQPQVWVVSLVSAHVNPASVPEAVVRAIKTDFVIPIPELAPQCPVDPESGISCTADSGAQVRGVQQGMVFTPDYRIYSARQRAIIRAKLKAAHYTHLVINGFCDTAADYHGVYPSCATSAKVGLNDALHEIWDDGLVPVPFLLQDAEPDDLTTPIGFDQQGGDPSLVRIASVYWEHTNVSCAFRKVHRLHPSWELYWHNPVGADGPYGDECYGGNGDDALYPGVFNMLGDLMRNGAVGLLLQNGDGDLGSTIGRIADFTASCGAGLRGGDPCRGLDIVWFEDQPNVYDSFWGGFDPAARTARANQVLKYLTTPLCEDMSRAVVPDGFCGLLAGFGSGGSSR